MALLGDARLYCCWYVCVIDKKNIKYCFFLPTNPFFSQCNRKQAIIFIWPKHTNKHSNPAVWTVLFHDWDQSETALNSTILSISYFLNDQWLYLGF